MLELHKYRNVIVGVVWWIKYRALLNCDCDMFVLLHTSAEPGVAVKESRGVGCLGWVWEGAMPFHRNFYLKKSLLKWYYMIVCSLIGDFIVTRYCVTLRPIFKRCMFMKMSQFSPYGIKPSVRSMAALVPLWVRHQ